MTDDTAATFTDFSKNLSSVKERRSQAVEAHTHAVVVATKDTKWGYVVRQGFVFVIGKDSMQGPVLLEIVTITSIVLKSSQVAEFAEQLTSSAYSNSNIVLSTKV